MQLIDTHAHLNDAKFQNDIHEVIARASEADVYRIIVPGYDLESSRFAVQIASSYDSLFATVGIHPHDAKSFDPESLGILTQLASHNKVLAIGEIGMDFHYDFSPRPEQLTAFEAQIDLAGELELPIVVHSRESNPEVMQVLKARRQNIHGCVLHCFSGDEAFARETLDAGFYIGVDGPLTYKASEKLRKIVEFCPMDRLLIETDCPYLTPIPHRGKRNEPAYVRYVAEELARVKGMTLEAVAEATTQNAINFFGQRLK